MSNVEAYNTGAGHVFEIETRPAIGVPDKADYWLYYVIARHEHWGERQYKVFVEKRHAPTQADADLIVTGEGLVEIKKRLETLNSPYENLLWATRFPGRCFIL